MSDALRRGEWLLSGSASREVMFFIGLDTEELPI